MRSGGTLCCFCVSGARTVKLCPLDSRSGTSTGAIISSSLGGLLRLSNLAARNSASELAVSEAAG